MAISLGTSVPLRQVPREPLISVLTLAEMNAGLSVATPAVRFRRHDHLRFIEETVGVIDFDPGCASAYGCISTATAWAGRKVRGRRSVDLMIAATALAHGLPIYTRNAADLRGLDGLIEIVDLS